MKKFLATAASLLVLHACADTGTNPDPAPQQPAPNADPQPTDKPKKYYVRYGFEQEDIREVSFTWHYNLKKETKYSNGLEFHVDHEPNGQGIAKLDIYALEKHNDIRMRCLILYRSDSNADWVIVAESEGTRECHATAPIS